MDTDSTSLPLARFIPVLQVNVLVFSLREGRLQVLLVRAEPDEFPNCRLLPGGPLQAGLSLEETASHELNRWLAARETYLEQLYTYGDPDRHPNQRVVSVVYFALIPASMKGSTLIDAEPAEWFPLDSLPELGMDHGEIITYGLRRLRYKLEYTAVGFQLLPETFTLSELQRTYEMILGETLDKRNFRRRILEAGIIEPTAHFRGGEGRPAQLYRYRADAVAEVKARRLFP